VFAFDRPEGIAGRLTRRLWPVARALDEARKLRRRIDEKDTIRFDELEARDELGRVLEREVQDQRFKGSVPNRNPGTAIPPL
jgi:hypothetical protein